MNLIGMHCSYRLKMPYLVLVLLCSMLHGAEARTVVFYVATNGNDGWSGQSKAPNWKRTDGPFRTIQKALENARIARQAGPPDADIQILLRGGTHVLSAPIVLTGLDSGSDAKHPLVIAPFGKEAPVISGETVITGWRQVATNSAVWQTTIPAVRDGKWVFRELFVNGKRKQRARTPNEGFFRIQGASPQDHPARLKFRAGDIKQSWAQQGDVEVVALLAWADFRMFIRSVDETNSLATLSTNPRPSNRERNARYYIENAPDALDRPGEWYLDRATGLLTYWSEPGEDLEKARIAAPHLDELVELRGSEQNPVKNIEFRNLIFADTDWRIPAEGYADTQAAIDVHGAFRAEWAHDCIIEKCLFTRIGGYALDFGAGCQNNRIIGNEMCDLGGGGIRLGHPSAEVGTTQPTRQNTISDNHIHHIGLVYPPAIGVIILQSGQNHVAHNHIHHTHYSAISVGWSWGYAVTPTRENIIEFNYLHHIGQAMLSDMGAVYTLGVQPGTVVRNNLIHDVDAFTYGGWGMYTDEGSTGMLWESNVVYRCKASNFHQHYGKENVIRNNILAFGRERQIMRTRPEAHTSFFFTNNIVYFDSGELLGNNWSGDNYVIDYNIYYDTRVGTNAPLTLQGSLTLDQWRERGHDVHSIIADPLFVDPKADDFHLRPQSPALKLGFKPIDLSTVGVRRSASRLSNRESAPKAEENPQDLVSPKMRTSSRGHISQANAASK